MKSLFRIKKILLEVTNEFLWVYLLGLTILWFVALSGWVLTREFDAYNIGWLIVIGFGLAGLFSYIASYYLTHTHFWKVILLLNLVFLFTNKPLLVGVIYLAWTLPLIYALFRLGFKDKAHIQQCIFNSWRHGFPAPPGYVEEIKVTQPQLETIFRNLDNLLQQQSQPTKNSASRLPHYS